MVPSEIMHNVDDLHLGNILIEIGVYHTAKAD